MAMQPVGRFNVYNALAALTVTTELGIPPETAAAGLEDMPPVRGRFERVASSVRDVFIDYAHTPRWLAEGARVGAAIHPRPDHRGLRLRWRPGSQEATDHGRAGEPACGLVGDHFR